MAQKRCPPVLGSIGEVSWSPGRGLWEVPFRDEYVTERDRVVTLTGLELVDQAQRPQTETSGENFKEAYASNDKAQVWQGGPRAIANVKEDGCQESTFRPLARRCQSLVYVS